MKVAGFESSVNPVQRVTMVTFQVPISLSKTVAELNILLISVTAPVSQLLISPLKAPVWENI